MTGKVDRGYSVVICTCQKYSDLWEANAYLLNKNWGDRSVPTYLVTDSATDAQFDGIEVVCAGAGAEITERLSCALSRITTEYVVFLLDDYFLTTKIDSALIDKVELFATDEKVDYVRLYPATKSYIRKEDARESSRHSGFFIRNIDTGTYKISLYPGFWRTSFMRSTLRESMNAWQYEVALTPMAREYGAKCAISNHNELPFLDVIRKGKILRKASRYFRRYPIYSSKRETMKFRDELLISVSTYLRRTLPKSMFLALKKALIRRGHVYYSPPE